MSNYKNISLEKGMYGVKGKSFTDVLEELDPSEKLQRYFSGKSRCIFSTVKAIWH